MAGLQDIIGATADQIRDTLQATIDASSDPIDIAIQVEPRWILAPTPLAIDVIPGLSTRDTTTVAFGDIAGAYVLTVRARINTPDFDSSYDILLALMDDNNDLSLAAAVADDPTLNGYVTSTDLRDFTGLQAYERIDGSGADLGFQFTVLAIPAES